MAADGGPVAAVAVGDDFQVAHEFMDDFKNAQQLFRANLASGQKLLQTMSPGTTLDGVVEIRTENVGRADETLPNVALGDPVQDEFHRFAAETSIASGEVSAVEQSEKGKPVEVMSPMTCAGVEIPINVVGELMCFVIEFKTVSEHAFGKFQVF